MSGRNYLGEFEHIVVLALLRLGDQAYGVTVRREIEARRVTLSPTWAIPLPSAEDDQNGSSVSRLKEYMP
jgi:hypothetical protein